MATSAGSLAVILCVGVVSLYFTSHQVDLAVSDKDFDKKAPTLSNYQAIVLDPWTWAGKGTAERGSSKHLCEYPDERLVSPNIDACGGVFLTQHPLYMPTRTCFVRNNDASCAWFDCAECAAAVGGLESVGFPSIASPRSLGPLAPSDENIFNRTKSALASHV